MNNWGYAFEPADLCTGLPVGAVAEVERLAAELAALGADADTVGRPEDRVGGLRQFTLFEGRGFFSYLVDRHHEDIVIVQVVWFG
ncbi:hypothetical protein [Nocardiopsis baichengensis]|uniref:hypothetical protein n=1 Tax=Nocardiopsis baichengensis TaxID=280240 RepID=UPI000348B04B|nr:hypothetical protein [Nocardiopsis baichengensis]